MKGGLIGIVKGKFKVIDPQEGGKRAQLYPPEEGVIVFINGNLVESAIEVGEEDTIESVPLTFTEDPRLEVKISSDALLAFLAVYPRRTVSHFLQDEEPSPVLKPRVGKKEERENTFTLLDVENELKSKGVVYGIDYHAVKECLEKADGEFRVIARGKEVKEGKDGWVEFLINPEVEVITYSENTNRVDYRERFRYPSVKKGDVIALVHPPEEGVPGQTVTGRIIPPKPVKKARIRCGEGVDFAEKETKVVALRDGRLVVKGNSVKVVNLLVHHGDVDLESGNFRFPGDIVIYGNVTEGMLVEALGDVRVEGSAYGATIRAGGGIEIARNAIRCRIEGGLFHSLLKEILPLLKQLSGQYSVFLENLREVLKEVYSRGHRVSGNTLWQIVQAVREKVAPQMDDHLKRLEKLLEKKEYSYLDELRKMLEIFKHAIAFQREENFAPELERLSDSLQRMIDKFQTVLDDLPLFTAAYVQSSSINHAGNVIITGTGCYFSTVNAAGEVKIQGVFRGGSIDAGGNVRVKEFIYISTAAELGGGKSPIRIKVPAHASIYFDLVYEDTVVQVGKMVYRFEQKRSKVRVAYDSSSGKLKILNY